MSHLDCRAAGTFETSAQASLRSQGHLYATGFDETQGPPKRRAADRDDRDAVVGALSHRPDETVVVDCATGGATTAVVKRLCWPAPFSFWRRTQCHPTPQTSIEALVILKASAIPMATATTVPIQKFLCSVNVEGAIYEPPV